MTCDQLPARLDLSLYIGATFYLNLTFKTGDGSTPVDLTGYTADMKVKAGTATLLELSTTNGRIVLGGVAGTIVCTVTATDTSALTQANANYDLLLTALTGDVTPLIAGEFLIQKGVTV